MQQFGWLSERGGNLLNLLQKEEGSLGKGGGGVPTLEETVIILWKIWYHQETLFSVLQVHTAISQ